MRVRYPLLYVRILEFSSGILHVVVSGEKFLWNEDDTLANGTCSEVCTLVQDLMGEN